MKDPCLALEATFCSFYAGVVKSREGSLGEFKCIKNTRKLLLILIAFYSQIHKSIKK